MKRFLFLAFLAATPAAATELVLGKLEKVEVKGDLRLRHESFDFRQGTDRHRQRFRLRIGTDLAFTPRWKMKVRFASGTGEQTSTNQSFDNLSTQKAFWIDQVQMDFSPADAATLRMGKMANPLWTTNSSDIVWDTDATPEGFSESFKFGRFFVNGLQMAADEDSGTNSDQWLVSTQAGLSLPLGDSKLTVAGALHEWVNETTTTRKNAGTFGQAGDGQGINPGGARAQTNREYASGVLQNEFRVMELTASLETSLAAVPLAVQGTYIKNVAHLDTGRGTFSAADGEKLDTGYQFGAIAGSAKKKGGLEAALFRKHIEADATVADVADADFGPGGTNRAGTLGWVAYGLEDFLTVSIKAFNTRLVNTNLNGGRPNDVNRFQLDLVAKF